MKKFHAIKIKDNIYWVGAIDWDLRNFHGFITPRGTTYNAYLIVDKKVTLIDTVKEQFADEMLERISSVVAPDKLDYVVFNHVEMDHSGSLLKVRAAAPKAKFVADKRGAIDLNRHYKSGEDFMTVATGDKLSVGSRELSFIEVPMVHWPDSMVTYSSADRILFSNDAFGQHVATLERFDEGMGFHDLLSEAAKYYANIVLPLAGPAGKAVAAIKGLDIDVIAPSHGIIWRKHVKEIVAKYENWAANKTMAKAVVVYDSMWRSTEKMALSIAEGIAFSNIKARLFNLKTTDVSEIMKVAIDAKAIIVGSPTLNNGMLPTMGAFLTYLKGLKPKGRIGFVFGSYGWSGGAAKAMEAELKATGIELMLPAKEIKYVPDPAELVSCFELGRKAGELIQGSS